MENIDSPSIKLENKNYFESINPYVMTVFFVYVIAWYLQLGTRWEILGKIRFEFIIATFLAICSLVYHKDRKLKNTGLLNILIAFYVVCIVSFLFTPSLERSWFVFVNYVVKFTFFSWFIYELIRGPKALKIFMIAVFLAWLKMGQEGFYGTLTGSMLWMNQGVMRLHGTTGLYFHPNSFSGFAVGTLPFIFYYLPIVKKWPRYFLVIQLVFSLNIILHTGSRTGYVGFFALIVYVIVKSTKKYKVLILSIFMAILIVPQIPHQYVERVESIFTGEDKAGQSTEKRKEIIRDSIAIFINNPMGVGVGTFPEIRYRVFGREQDTHNLYLQIATNLGIQGLIVFSWLIVCLFKNLTKVENISKTQIAKLKEIKIQKNKIISKHLFDLEFIQATSQAAKMFLFARLTLGLFGHDLYEIYWWFLIGITSALFYLVQISESKTRDLFNI